MNRPKFIMMVGLVASGKSTKAKELSEEHNATIFSSDALREEMFNDINDQEHNQELFVELHKRIKECLRNGKNAIMDATNLNYKKRMAFLADLKNIPCEKICVVMATPYNECISNNKGRDRKVPEDVIKRMRLNFQCPHYFEGWDDIKIVYKDYVSKPAFNRGSFESMIRYKMKGFNQNNPHHIHDLYNHSKAVMFQYQEDDIRRVAAILHDCMKSEVETIDDNNISHYYKHENASAYYVLTHPKVVNCITYEDMLNIIFYITYHMLAHNIVLEKTQSKYRKIFGKELYDSLMDFAEKDKSASNQAVFNFNYQNIYIKKEDYTIGYTRLGDMFLVDIDDVDALSNYTWCVKNKNNGDYRLVSLTDGEMRFQHRIIMDVDNRSIVVDHINHKQYDNRKCNLRLCSARENSLNTSLSKNNTSGINGVSVMQNGKYRAYINDNYKQIHLGCYDTVEDAQRARQLASMQLYDEFANLAI